MNIPDEAITQYPDNNATIVDDPRVFRGVLIAAETWGSLTLSEPSSGGTEYIDEIIAEFADKAADLRAKYEVTGDTLNGESAIENDYYEELNTLLTKYRTLIFQAVMDYIGGDDAIDLILEVLRLGKQKKQ